MLLRDLNSLGIDPPVMVLIGVAVFLMMVAVVILSRLLKPSRPRLRSQSGARTEKDEEPERSAESVFAAPGAPLLSLNAELLERRPLSEAQWDSPVPAAWTIFRLKIDDEGQFQLGLLLPVQHKEAYSSGFIERTEGSASEPILQGLAKALGGAVPGPAISGSNAGFLEFKSYVQNEKPEVIPGNLDLSAADYWIFVKVFVQNTLEFYMRINPQKQMAEIAAGKPAQAEELMRVLAATLRPETKTG